VSVSKFTQTHTTSYATVAQKNPVFRETLERVHV